MPFAEGEVFCMLGENVFTFMAGKADVGMHRGRRTAHCGANELFPERTIKLEQRVSDHKVQG
jgi:hypothetical protein